MKRNILALLFGFVFLFASGVLADADPYPGMACTDCHDDKLSKPVKHAPAESDCRFCHAPHGTDTGHPNRLYDKGNNVCFACHDKTTEHPVSGHPVDGKKDPLYPNRELSCVSCHNPHSAPTAKLFRYDIRPDKTPYIGEACAVCHFDYYFGNSKPQPPTPPWE